MTKQYELCINGVRIRAIANPAPHYKFEKWTQTAQRWTPIRTNDSLHRAIINRDK